MRENRPGGLYCPRAMGVALGQRLTVTTKRLSVNCIMHPAVKAFFSANGRKGGKSTSAAKLAAIKANLDKARAKRWPAKPKVAPVGA